MTISRYHRFRQHDGKGFGILLLDAKDPSKATVVYANLGEDDANRHLTNCRACESAQKDAQA